MSTYDFFYDMHRYIDYNKYNNIPYKLKNVDFDVMVTNSN